MTSVQVGSDMSNNNRVLVGSGSGISRFSSDFGLNFLIVDGSGSVPSTKFPGHCGIAYDFLDHEDL